MLKFIGLTAVVTVLLLISYRLFVRYTPIGTLLKGKRTRPEHRAPTKPPAPTGIPVEGVPTAH